MCQRLGTPDSSHKSVSRGRRISRLPRFTHLLRPARLLGALYGSDQFPSHRRLLLPGFQRDRPVAGYDYSIDWTPLLAGLSTAEMAARLAARHTFSVRWAVRFLGVFCRVDNIVRQA